MDNPNPPAFPNEGDAGGWHPDWQGMTLALLNLFRRPQPTTFTRCLAAHIYHASHKGTLR